MRATRALRRVIAAGAIALAGCAPEAPEPVAVEVRDSAGVRMVLNRGAADVPLRVREVLRIGVVDGEEPYMFSRIAAMATDQDGNLFVANVRSGTIRVFSPDGRFLREFGGRGEGPGEFRGFVATSWRSFPNGIPRVRPSCTSRPSCSGPTGRASRRGVSSG